MNEGQLGTRAHTVIFPPVQPPHPALAFVQHIASYHSFLATRNINLHITYTIADLPPPTTSLDTSHSIYPPRSPTASMAPPPPASLPLQERLLALAKTLQCMHTLPRSRRIASRPCLLTSVGILQLDGSPGMYIESPSRKGSSELAGAE